MFPRYVVVGLAVVVSEVQEVSLLSTPRERFVVKHV